ncbi:MAG TPA: hypothetical protein VFB19_21375 [Mycobacterium sp.]|nr:hypothetical protein [Mycobacterium sp.]
MSTNNTGYIPAAGSTSGRAPTRAVCVAGVLASVIGSFAVLACVSAPTASAMPAECQIHHDAFEFAYSQGDYEWGDVELSAYNACVARN